MTAPGHAQASRAEALPLESLDRALAPVRRVVSWAGADPESRVESVRFFETIAKNWLGRALALDLPDSVREQIDQIVALLDGFDSDDTEGRERRIIEIDQVVRRLDALLGLPLPVKLTPHRPAVPLEALLQPEPEPEPERRPAPRKRRVRRQAAPPPAPPEPEPEPEPEPLWNGDLSTPLADLEFEPDLVEALAAEEIHTTGQLLRLAPMGEEAVPLHGAGREVPEGRVAIGGRVAVRYSLLRPGQAPVHHIRLRGAGPVTCRMTQPPDWSRGTDDWLETWAHDQRVVAVGELIEEDDQPVLLDPESAADDGRHEARLQGFGLEGVADVAVRHAQHKLLRHADAIRDPLPNNVRSRFGLMPLGQALADFHRLGSTKPEARARLAFDELLLAQLALSSRRFQAHRDRGIPHVILHGLASRLGGGELLLDDEQQLALEEIKRDLRQPTPMLRVLLGEVGAGKGLVALITAVTVADAKSQVLVVAPDRAVAEERFTMAEPLLREAGLVARRIDEDSKRSWRDAVGRGEVHIVFGTLDLLEQGIEFRRLGLVIAEEREHWGRASAALHRLRSPRPHALVIPSVPIGAAVALTAYADHDISVIGGGGLQPVEVEILTADERERAYAAAAEVVASGRQVVMLFPMVRGGDALTLREAHRVVQALRDDALSEARVALFHGAMSREERQKVYDDFLHRRSDVLVATTLVEDGPPVPDASLVVVEQADRVESTRLHRIRGFLSRSRHPARAVLVVGEMSEAGAADRLRRHFEPPDGHDLHETWLSTNGLGEGIVEEAPPIPQFAWADPIAHREWLWKARELAHELLRSDGLRRGWGVELAKEARARFEDLWPAEEGEGTAWPCPIPDAQVPQGEKRRRRRRRRKR